MTTTENPGSLMKYQAECGHWCVVYSLKPTPAQCPDCADAGRKALEDIVFALGGGYLDDIPSLSDNGLEEWLDECGVSDPDLRKDVRQLVDLADNAREELEHAEHVGRQLLKKYPRAERLSMP